MTQNLAVTQYTAKTEIYLIATVQATDKLLWVDATKKITNEEKHVYIVLFLQK